MNHIKFFVIVVASIAAGMIISGCINPELDPFLGYHDELRGNPDHLVRVASYYNPDFTPEAYMDAAKEYGLERGTPANVGRWAVAMIVVYGDGSTSLDDPKEADADDAPLCERVEPGAMLEVPSDEEWKRFCISLDEDENGRTHFFLPGEEAVIVGFFIRGLATESAASARDDCVAPMYWRGGTGDPRAPSVEVEPIPGQLEIGADRDVIVHFGILCG